jgi:hypothetical protein
MKKFLYLSLLLLALSTLFVFCNNNPPTQNNVSVKTSTELVNELATEIKSAFVK